MDEDLVIRAEKNIEAEIQAGLARARMRESPPPGFDGVCECGVPIPVARIELGYYRCLCCQTIIEDRWRRTR